MEWKLKINSLHAIGKIASADFFLNNLFHKTVKVSNRFDSDFLSIACKTYISNLLPIWGSLDFENLYIV